MNAIQLPLLETDAQSQPKGKANFSDPNFASNKTKPIHRWVPWIAGFASDFVRGVLDKHLPEKGVVLDPFAGVGTTLVEAAHLGHAVIGFEINPYAALACRVKLNAVRFGRVVSDVPVTVRSVGKPIPARAAADRARELPAAS